MNFCVDGRPFSKPLTGIGRYTFEILSRLPLDIALSLVSDEAFTTTINKDLLSYKQLYRYQIPQSMGKLLWQQIQISKFIAKTHPNLFWSPRHHLPLFGCKNTPMILTIHDLVYRKYPETMKRSNWLLEKLLLAASVKRADHIITISESTKKDLMTELKTPADKITVIHSGYFEPTLSTGVDLKAFNITQPYILFLGTLEPRKNVDRLIEAYLSLPDALKNSYQLVIAGGKGWKSKKILTKIHAAENSDQIRHLGYVNDAEISALYQHATCFTFPSLYEGFGLPILEAMRMGCPVLTSHDPACVEVGGGATLNVDAFSTQSIRNGLQTMLTNADVRQKLIDKGFENIKRFSWDKAAAQHLEIFKRFAK